MSVSGVPCVSARPCLCQVCPACQSGCVGCVLRGSRAVSCVRCVMRVNRAVSVSGVSCVSAELSLCVRCVLRVSRAVSVSGASCVSAGRVSRRGSSRRPAGGRCVSRVRVCAGSRSRRRSYCRTKLATRVYRWVRGRRRRRPCVAVATATVASLHAVACLASLLSCPSHLFTNALMSLRLTTMLAYWATQQRFCVAIHSRLQYEAGVKLNQNWYRYTGLFWHIMLIVLIAASTADEHLYDVSRCRLLCSQEACAVVVDGATPSGRSQSAVALRSPLHHGRQWSAQADLARCSPCHFSLHSAIFPCTLTFSQLAPCPF